MSSALTASAIVGAGPVFAADQDSGTLVYWVKNKLAFGVDGTRTDVAPGAGLPVQQQAGATWAISAVSLPLPAGASTAAKQPAIGTAGSASADVITVQGIASMMALKVDGSAVTQPVSGNVAVTGTFWQATQPVSGTVTANAGANLNTSLLALEAGGNLATLTGAVTSAKIQANVRPATSGGLTPSKLISAASTNSTSVKGSAGQLYDFTATNINASPRYLKLYDKATAPTVGTDTPVLTYLIPGNTAGGGLTKTIPLGLAFSAGIAFALTTGSADNDTGAVAAGDLIVDLMYA